MASNSINSNYGAQVALHNLNATNRQLETTQNRLNTGFKVATAKDNGAVFAVATNMRAEAASLDAVTNSINRGQSMVDVALAAGETITEAYQELKALSVAIKGAESGSSSLAAYQADFDAIVEEIEAALEAANFDEKNLFSDTVTVMTGLEEDAELEIGSNFSLSVTNSSEPDDVQEELEEFTAALAELGTQSKSLQRQGVFISKLQGAMETGVDNLVAADLAKESSKLVALQTKQQLGAQALSIANSSSNILLSLFR